MRKHNEMKKIETQILGSNRLPISLDITFLENDVKKPVVIFCHGFKGFKDWGAWHLVAEAFAEKGFVFLKFNFSHNGTTPENATDFANLEAFSENNYTKELSDLEFILDYVFSEEFPISKTEIDFEKINLIGHSRGGGAVLVKTTEDDRVKEVATLASIDSYDRFGTPAEIEEWKSKGEHIFVNGRTGQKMPIKYKFYEDYVQNKERLNIEKAVSNTDKPLLIVHGSEDPAVHLECAENIYSWSKNAKLLTIENANHVFGASHPYTKNVLPEDLQIAVNEMVSFFK